MAAYPAYTVTFSLKDDCANYPVSGGNPDATTAISDDAKAHIKNVLAPFAVGGAEGVTVTQA